MKKIDAVTFEIEETLTITSTGGRRAMCETCGDAVWMTTPAAIALESGISERTLFRLIESSALDCNEEGRLVVCPQCVASLLAAHEIPEAKQLPTPKALKGEYR